ncbi:MAG: phosphatase PAP2 family protein [Sulfuricurvum sp.]|jgi:membrane-associated phospholipid phosphatase|uniref:phosphatase PAP2 family protein n=1 Tax=Sulfuricurvum sp. TaxID=2025608 RepID=UPI0025D711FB|nr:phosphatase PAP2 family protein [Sulfuricurvum sp.]MCK9373326.1 phosphatase PAP2 family protein [Sulfuricurvum sp.]
MKTVRWRLETAALLLAATVSYLFFDRSIALYCAHACTGEYNAFFSAVTKLGVSTPYLLISGLLYLYFYTFRKDPYSAYPAKFVFLAVAVSGIAADIVKVIAGRFRPSLFLEQGLYGFDFFHLKAAMLSFPSGHTATAFALAAVIALYRPRWALIGWGMAFMVGLSRITLTMHYTSDVLVGALIGIMTVKILALYEPNRNRLNANLPIYAR